MKLEARFKTSDNKLYTLDGAECAIYPETFESEKILGGQSSLPEGKGPFALSINWTTVGLDDQSYNEEFLASFRDFLKQLEEDDRYVLIVPVADKNPSSTEEKSALTASMKHCARRLKDCASIVGFAVPEESDPEEFISELRQKHQHYAFFSRDTNLLQDKSIVKF